MLQFEIPNVFFDILEGNLDDLIGSSKKCRPTHGNWANGSCPRGSARRQFRYRPMNANKSTDCPLKQGSCCHAQSVNKAHAESQPTTTITNSDLFTASFDLRSFEPSEISVKLEDNTLMVQANHEVTTDGQYELRQYVKRVPMPDNVLTDQLRSTLDQSGQLLIEAPLKKPEEEKNSSRDIPIEFVKKPQTLEDLALD